MKGTLVTTVELGRFARARWRAVDHVCRRATASLRMQPDFLIIGGSKCGTTSLYDNLIQNPCVLEAAVKEIHFFDVKFSRGMDWYRAHFPLAIRRRQHNSDKEARQTGEASPYYMFHPHAAARIHATLPHVKAIAMLRNPIDRAYSQHQHEVRVRRESLPFTEAIDAEESRLRGERERMVADRTYNSFAYRRYSYQARGVYVDQLHEWLTYFDRRQLLIVNSEEFFAHPDATMQQVIKFLELPAWKPRVYLRKNTGAYDPIDKATRQRLREYFEPHNARLYEFIGQDYGWI